MSAHAISAYRAGASLAAEPRHVLYLLHDEAARALSSAKFAYEQNALDQTCLHLNRAHRILMGLLSHLQFDEAGAAGAQLRILYLRLARRVFRVLSDSNVAVSLDDCVRVFQMLRDGEAKEIDVRELICR